MYCYIFFKQINYLLSQSPTIFLSQTTDSLLLNEAFSNYAVFVLGIIVGVIGWIFVHFISKRQPQIIQVVRKEQVSLLKIDSQVEQDIKLAYKGTPIDSLHRTSLDLFNRGEEIVKDFTLTIQTQTYDLQNKILETLIVDASDNEVKDSRVSLSDKSMEIKLTFLNPFRQYKDRLKLYIFSSNPIEIRDAKGRGPGWGAAYFDQVEYGKELEDSFSTFWSSGALPDLLYGVSKSLAIVIKRVVR